MMADSQRAKAFQLLPVFALTQATQNSSSDCCHTPASTRSAIAEAIIAKNWR